MERVVFIYVIIIGLLYLLFNGFAFSYIRNKQRTKPQSQGKEGMTILIPCYNEQDIITSNLRGICDLCYSNYEVIYINDGSADQTFRILNEQLQLTLCNRKKLGKLEYAEILGFYQSLIYPHIFVVDKKNGGKADSLNAGIEFSSKPIIITLDADSILKEDALHVVNQTFQDSSVMGGGGVVRILQGKSTATSFSLLPLIVRFQTLEYLRTFLINRSFYSKWNAMILISGAFGIFRTSLLMDIGGFRKTIGEDLDITLRIHRHLAIQGGNFRIAHIPNAVCYTECPESWRDLIRQRIRWQKGFIDCFLYNKGMVSRQWKSRIAFIIVFQLFLVETITPILIVMSPVLISLGLPLQNHVVVGISLFACLNLLQTFFILYIDRSQQSHYKYRDYIFVAATVAIEVISYRWLVFICIAFGSVLYFFNQHNWNKVGRTGREYLPTSAKISGSLDS